MNDEAPFGHWAERYIGLTWTQGAEGPDAFDCWGLVRHVQRERYGRAIPVLPEAEPALARRQLAAWRVVPEPQDGDCMLALRPGDAHVGVYVEVDGGGVLHSVQGVGVIFTAIARLPVLGFSGVVWYRHTGA